ncbi:MAG: type IV pilin-like G/H family protein [Aphanizomenon gracile PMC644.10]|nr:type IV pilin-like G/H family protein [Aphanizomenon gracile PMC644.10]
MKTELKAKFLQHLLGKKKDDQGFTLIELLVVIIIIGILSAIALPSFLNQAKKAKQSEAKTYVGSMNRGQQAYMTENDVFGTDINLLGVGINTTTANYTYGTSSSGAGAGAYALNTSAQTVATSGLKNYGGMVYLKSINAQNELTSVAFLCETKNVNTGGSQSVSVSTSACDTTNGIVIK